MKAPLPALLAFLALWSTAVRTRASLAVVNGSLGSQTTPGAANDVWADPATADTVFDRWVGDVSVLADPYAWHTTALVPASSAVVTATYRASPAWTPTTSVLNGRAANDASAVRLIRYFPANPVGVIFFFHGSGGSASGWFFNNVENQTFLRDAVAAGFAVAALDSTDRENRQWDGDATSGNVDVASVQSAINFLVNAGLMTTGTPKFAVGMSNGGGFAPKPAYYLGFKACGIFCAAGAPRQLFEQTTVPAIWSLARNDDLFDHTTFLQSSTANLNALAGRAIAGELRENVPSPVYPRRFLRIPELTASDSQTIFDSLSNGGFLDPSGYLKADPSTSGFEGVLPAVYQPFRAGILDQLACCYSGHKFFSDYDNRVLRFFGEQNLAPFFRGAVPLSDGFSYLQFGNGIPFGYYNFNSAPYLYHADMGFQYPVDAGDGSGGIYLYDFTSQTFFYTRPDLFPYLYDFSLSSFLYYYPDTGNPGHYTVNPRFFFNFATGGIITK